MGAAIVLNDTVVFTSCFLCTECDFVVIMSTPRSIKEFELHVQVMRDKYRRLLGIREGPEADLRFMEFCRQCVHVNDGHYQTLDEYLASQHDPSPPSPTISISSAPAVMSRNTSTPQASSAALTPSSAATSKACSPSTVFRTPEASTSAGNITPQPSTTSAAEFFYHEFKDPTISPIVHKKLFPCFIDTQLFTPPSLIQTPRDATHSSHSDDTIILEDAPQSSQDMTDDTIVIQDASQDVSDSEEDITIGDTCTY